METIYLFNLCQTKIGNPSCSIQSGLPKFDQVIRLFNNCKTIIVVILYVYYQIVLQGRGDIKMGTLNATSPTMAQRGKGINNIHSYQNKSFS